MKKYEVRKSPIHGNGVFAACDIAEGEWIIDYLGEKIDKEESNRRGLANEEAAKSSGGGAVYIFELDDKYDIDGNFEYNDARFINHACRTNCEAVNEDGTIKFYATRDIKKGEELLYNYGYALEHFLDHPCRCGFPECVGYIVAEWDRLKLRKLLKGRRPKKH
ncbi:SET domain-containing protein-lysine N-methyltransferase [Opitutia bacterium KCR 482]|nr:SET domain-containing protein-lysine N-methyltransferase [Opitutae bacterium KCR 482]